MSAADSTDIEALAGRIHFVVGITTSDSNTLVGNCCKIITSPRKNWTYAMRNVQKLMTKYRSFHMVTRK